MKNCLASLTSAWVYFRWMPCKNARIHTQSLSHVQLFVTPWTVVCQAPLSTEFSRQKYWSGLPFPPPGDLLDPGIKPASPVSYALVSGSLPLGHLGSPIHSYIYSAKWKGKSLSAQFSWPHGPFSSWNSPGQNTGVGSLSLLQGIFPTRDQTQVSRIAGGFFTSWVKGKLLLCQKSIYTIPFTCITFFFLLIFKTRQTCEYNDSLKSRKYFSMHVLSGTE